MVFATSVVFLDNQDLTDMWKASKAGLEWIILDAIYNDGRIQDVHCKMKKSVKWFFKSFDSIFTLNYDNNIEFLTNKSVYHLHGDYSVLTDSENPETVQGFNRKRGVIMTIGEILAGESKNVEFKENLPEKSIQYMKSVVSFANGTGGKIIFGIADETREVVGQTVDGKAVIVVEVSEGRQRPYYIKALGREGGVYVRVAGTTRLADEYMIKELLFEGSNRYFDQVLCTGLTITDEEIGALCKAMKEQAVKNAHNEEQKASIKDVGRQQLRSWGVLIGGEVDLRINIYRGQIDLNTASKVPDNAKRMPDTIREVPDNTKGMPDNAKRVPNTIKKVPNTASKVPDTIKRLPDNEQKQQIYRYVLENGSITSAKVVKLLGVKHRRARAVLRDMVEGAYLKKEGAARSTIYVKNTEGR